MVQGHREPGLGALRRGPGRARGADGARGEVAWHAGRSAMRPNLPDGDPHKEPNVNSFSVGIELVGTADSGFTDRQLASLYTLIEVLVARHRIAPERVVGHCHVSPGRKIDPDGYDHQFNWAKVRNVAQVTYNAVVGT